MAGEVINGLVSSPTTSAQNSDLNRVLKSSIDSDLTRVCKDMNCKDYFKKLIFLLTLAHEKNDSYSSLKVYLDFRVLFYRRAIKGQKQSLRLKFTIKKS